MNFYFQLLSSKLVQNGDDDEELKGFLIADIKQELKRSAKLVRVFFSFLKLIGDGLTNDFVLYRHVSTVKNMVRASDVAENNAGNLFICIAP